MNNKNKQPKSHNPFNFNTSTERVRQKPEINSGELLTEQAGYIPLEAQLNRLTAAGVQLYEYRREMYDFADDEHIPANAEDPTRAPNYDMADASMALHSLERKYTEKRRDAANELLQKKLAESDESPLTEPTEMVEKEQQPD